MDDRAIVESILQTLTFEVDRDSKSNATKESSSKPKPFNVTIKVRKKDIYKPVDQGFISSFQSDSKKVHRTVRLVSSNDTILSFDMFMEPDAEKKSKNKNHKHFLYKLRPGRRSKSTDDDNNPDLPKAGCSIDESGSARKSEAILRHTPLTKNLEEGSAATLSRKVTFLGQKCKPGGCLDPPFDEDKYAYMPKRDSSKHDTRNKLEVKPIDKEVNVKADIENPDIMSDDLEGSLPIAKLDNVNVKKSISVLSLYKAGSPTNSVMTYPPVDGYGLIQTKVDGEGKKNVDVKIPKSRRSTEEKPMQLFDEHINGFFKPPKALRMNSNTVPQDQPIRQSVDSIKNSLRAPICTATMDSINVENTEFENISAVKLSQHSVKDHFEHIIPLVIPLLMPQQTGENQTTKSNADFVESEKSSENRSQIQSEPIRSSSITSSSDKPTLRTHSRVNNLIDPDDIQILIPPEKILDIKFISKELTESKSESLELLLDDEMSNTSSIQISEDIIKDITISTAKKSDSTVSEYYNSNLKPKSDSIVNLEQDTASEKSFKYKPPVKSEGSNASDIEPNIAVTSTIKKDVISSFNEYNNEQNILKSERDNTIQNTDVKASKVDIPDVLLISSTLFETYEKLPVPSDNDTKISKDPPEEYKIQPIKIKRESEHYNFPSGLQTLRTKSSLDVSLSDNGKNETPVIKSNPNILERFSTDHVIQAMKAKRITDEKTDIDLDKILQREASHVIESSSIPLDYNNQGPTTVKYESEQHDLNLRQGITTNVYSDDKIEILPTTKDIIPQKNMLKIQPATGSKQNATKDLNAQRILNTMRNFDNTNETLLSNNNITDVLYIVNEGQKMPLITDNQELESNTAEDLKVTEIETEVILPSRIDSEDKMIPTPDGSDQKTTTHNEWAPDSSQFMDRNAARESCDTQAKNQSLENNRVPENRKVPKIYSGLKDTYSSFLPTNDKSTTGHVILPDKLIVPAVKISWNKPETALQNKRESTYSEVGNNIKRKKMPTSNILSTEDFSSVSLDLAFHCFAVGDEIIVRTVPTDNEIPNDSLTIIKSQIKISAKESNHKISIPVNSTLDMAIKISKNNKKTLVPRNKTSIPPKSWPIIHPQINNWPSFAKRNCHFHMFTANYIKQAISKMHSIPKLHHETKYICKVHNNLTNLYEQELIPLEALIRDLKNEIYTIAAQQAIFKKKVLLARKSKIPRTIHSNRKCGSCKLCNKCQYISE